MLVREGERLAETGNVLADAANRERLSADDQALELLTRLSLRHGPVSDALSDAARAFKAGEIGRGEAARRFLGDVRRADLAQLEPGARAGGDVAGDAGPADRPAGAAAGDELSGGVREDEALGPDPRQQTFFQGEPVARLTGRELGDFGDDLKAWMTAARDVYRRLQAGPPAQHPTLGEIRFTRAGWDKLRTAGADVRRWKMIPRLREMLEAAEVMSVTPVREPRADGVVRFHWLETNVDLAGERLRIGLHVAEDGRGRKFYTLNHDLAAWRGKYEAPGRPREFEAGHQEPRGGDGSPLKQSSLPPDDDLNITLLGRPGEDSPRGAIEIGDRLTRIWLGPRADATTLIHEHGHLFLDILRDFAAAPGANEAATRDWGTVRDWLGAKEGAALTSAARTPVAASRRCWAAGSDRPPAAARRSGCAETR